MYLQKGSGVVGLDYIGPMHPEYTKRKKEGGRKRKKKTDVIGPFFFILLFIHKGALEKTRQGAVWW